MRFRYARVNPNAKLLRRGHPTDAGMDICIPTDWHDGQPFDLAFGESIVIDSGIKIEIDPGYMVLGGNKGGVASKRHLLLGAHISDSYYSGTVFLDIHNVGKDTQTLVPGEKIAQLIIVPIVPAIPEETTEDKLYEGMMTTEYRGDGKQGSTGV